MLLPLSAAVSDTASVGTYLQTPTKLLLFDPSLPSFDQSSSSPSSLSSPHTIYHLSSIIMNPPLARTTGCPFAATTCDWLARAAAPALRPVLAGIVARHTGTAAEHWWAAIPVVHRVVTRRVQAGSNRVENQVNREYCTPWGNWEEDLSETDQEEDVRGENVRKKDGVSRGDDWFEVWFEYVGHGNGEHGRGNDTFTVRETTNAGDLLGNKNDDDNSSTAPINHANPYFHSATNDHNNYQPGARLVLAIPVPGRVTPGSDAAVRMRVQALSLVSVLAHGGYYRQDRMFVNQQQQSQNHTFSPGYGDAGEGSSRRTNIPHTPALTAIPAAASTERLVGWGTAAENVSGLGPFVLVASPIVDRQGNDMLVALRKYEESSRNAHAYVGRGDERIRSYSDTDRRAYNEKMRKYIMMQFSNALAVLMLPASRDHDEGSADPADGPRDKGKDKVVDEEVDFFYEWDGDNVLHVRAPWLTFVRSSFIPLCSAKASSQDAGIEVKFFEQFRERAREFIGWLASERRTCTANRGVGNYDSLNGNQTNSDDESESSQAYRNVNLGLVPVQQSGDGVPSTLVMPASLPTRRIQIKNADSHAAQQPLSRHDEFGLNNEVREIVDILGRLVQETVIAWSLQKSETLGATVRGCDNSRQFQKPNQPDKLSELVALLCPSARVHQPGRRSLSLVTPYQEPSFDNLMPNRANANKADQWVQPKAKRPRSMVSSLCLMLRDELIETEANTPPPEV